MPLTKPNQDLRRDIQGLASDLKWSAVEKAIVAHNDKLSCDTSSVMLWPDTVDA